MFPATSSAAEVLPTENLPCQVQNSPGNGIVGVAAAAAAGSSGNHDAAVPLEMFADECHDDAALAAVSSESSNCSSDEECDVAEVLGMYADEGQLMVRLKWEGTNIPKYVWYM